METVLGLGVAGLAGALTALIYSEVMAWNIRRKAKAQGDRIAKFFDDMAADIAKYERQILPPPSKDAN